VVKGRGAAVRQGPKLRPELRYLWAIYCELDATRAVGMSLGPLTYTEIDAFSRLTATRLTPFEIGVLRAVDRAYFEHRAKEQSK